MSKNNKTPVPTKNSNTTSFQHPLYKDVMYTVCWARATDSGENRVAIFSMDEIHVPTGVATCTHNNLSILQLVPHDDRADERILEIGSSSKTFTDRNGEREIFSHTFFPRRRGNAAAEEAHRQFVERCTEAVKNFIEENNARYRKFNERRQEVRHNPLAEALRGLARNGGTERRTTNEVASGSD